MQYMTVAALHALHIDKLKMRVLLSPLKMGETECKPTLLCLHAMNTYFAKLGSYHSVSAREVYVTISGQRHPG